MKRSLIARIAPFIAEMATPAHRPKLWFGIWSGFAVVIAFGVLAALAVLSDLTPFRWVWVQLVAAKLATNSIAWLALQRDRWVMTAQAVNTTADVLLLTAGVYFTGGAYSPLVPAYVIIVAVLSLLSNFGITMLMAGFIVVCFSAMLILMVVGVLPPTQVLGSPGEEPTLGYVVVMIGYCALVVGVPAYFSGATLRLLRQREADLEHRTAQLIQTNSQRSQFVASMTHELRTPIHGVQGIADVMAAGVYGPVTERQKDACAAIKRSAQSLLRLVDDVLQLTRAEAGKIEAHPADVDVRELVEHVTASMAWVVGTKELALETAIDPDLPTVRSDDRWLAHVLVNLIANAVKFTPDGGRVTVAARARAGAVELAVTDTGIGIAAAERELIFEPFRQGEHGDERRYGGVGLGLALVARLCDLLACDVELDSAVGRGTTFRVIVPERWRGRRTTQLLRPPRAPTDEPIADDASG